MEIVKDPDLEDGKPRSMSATASDGVEVWGGRIVPGSDPPRRSEWKAAAEWWVFKSPKGEIEFNPQEDGTIYVITRSPNGLITPGQIVIGGASNQLFIDIYPQEHYQHRGPSDNPPLTREEE